MAPGTNETVDTSEEVVAEHEPTIADVFAVVKKLESHLIPDEGDANETVTDEPAKPADAVVDPGAVV
jgi:hypothetical protein